MRKKSVCISLLFAISLALPAQYLFALSGQRNGALRLF